MKRIFKEFLELHGKIIKKENIYHLNSKNLEILKNTFNKKQCEYEDKSAYYFVFFKAKKISTEATSFANFIYAKDINLMQK